MNRSARKQMVGSWVVPAIYGFICFIFGGRLAPLLYPYKAYSSDMWGDIAAMRLRSLGAFVTYFGPNALQGYLGLAVILAACLFLFGLSRPWIIGTYCLALGAYYDIMINGRGLGGAHDAFDRLVGPIMPAWKEMPLYAAAPLVLMLAIPLLVAYALSVAMRGRDCESEP